MITKGEWSLIVFNLFYILGFTFYYAVQRNYEFMLYIGVLVVLFALVLFLQRRVKFSSTILWMLSIWGLLHMMGGGVHFPADTVLYRWVPIEMYNAHDPAGEFVILKFDQILHFYVYFVLSFVFAHLLGRLMVTTVRPLYLFFFVVLASMGASVINELIEFGAVVYMGKTGVGGYYNTLLDLCFNTLGAVVGGILALKLKSH
ncbi:MAG: DUF2238 domain-containing protein [Nanoarchaeota archaeon]